MMPNLGQGGCQAIEDAYVLSQNLSSMTHRDQIPNALIDYRNRRLIRSAAVHGLSRFASDIIIRGFDTPAKVTFDGGLQVENFNYAGIVTRMLQPVLPIFFRVQFNFLYDGWKNEMALDVRAALLGLLATSGLVLLLGTGTGVVGELGLTFSGIEDVLGTESLGRILGYS